MRRLIRNNLVIAGGLAFLMLLAAVGAFAAPGATPWPDPFQGSGGPAGPTVLSGAALEPTETPEATEPPEATAEAATPANDVAHDVDDGAIDNVDAAAVDNVDDGAIDNVDAAAVDNVDDGAVDDVTGEATPTPTP